MKRYLIILLVSLVIVSCNNSKKFKIATGTITGKHYQIGKFLSQLLNEQTEYSFDLTTSGEGSVNNCEQIISGKADFALSQNDVIIPDGQNNLRTILPLYPQTLFIVYDSTLKANSLKDLISGRKIAVGSKKRGDSFICTPFVSRIWD